METVKMIKELRRLAKKHENDKVNTLDTNWSALCTDVANRLEELESRGQSAWDIIYNKALELEKKYEEHAAVNGVNSCIQLENLLQYFKEELKGEDTEKADTHIVIKREDVLKYLTEVEYRTLEQILCIISKGRSKEGKKPVNSYYICNTDEPYAEVVHGVIIGGEHAKEGMYRR